ncbi:hypothetical protein ACIRF8_24375 [Streptomyces sp. NPDC102406]|uniref:hypothetical protein n=1 Tax=Streptomyces sp. NPDC102406 TaxID=3366171 RepID=UPI00380BFF7A
MRKRKGTGMEGTGARGPSKAGLLVLLVLPGLLCLLCPLTPLPPAYATEPSPHGALAGSRAGVGRTPPGRPLPAPTFDEPGIPPPPRADPPSTPPSPRPERPVAARDTAVADETEPLVNVVPLGAGLLLTGLGIGFLALRLRR